MKAKIPLIARLVLGLIFAGAGITGLIQYTKGMSLPPETPAAAAAFFNAMMGTGFLFPLLKLTETACGLALLTGTWVPLALVVLAPIVINIFFFHIFVMPVMPFTNLIVPLLVVALEIYLARAYWTAFKPVLAKK